MNVKFTYSAEGIVETLTIKDYRGEHTLVVDAVESFKAEDGIVLVKSDNAHYLIDSSLKRLIAILPTAFIEVHRNRIINTSFAVGWYKNEIIMDSGELYPMSRRKKPFCKLALKKLSKQEYKLYTRQVEN